MGCGWKEVGSGSFKEWDPRQGPYCLGQKQCQFFSTHRLYTTRALESDFCSSWPRSQAITLGKQRSPVQFLHWKRETAGGRGGVKGDSVTQHPTLCLAWSSPLWAGLWGSRSAASIQWHQGQGLSPGSSGKGPRLEAMRCFFVWYNFPGNVQRVIFDRFSIESQTSLRGF